MTTFGAQLRLLRKRARLTQRDLGIAIGYSESQVNRIERDVHPLDPALVVAHAIPALALDPTGEDARHLLQLAHETRAGSAAPPVELHIPLADGPLIGRSAQLDALLALLRRDGVRLITLHGLGGVGKTRLAVAVMSALAETFPVLRFVPLAALTDPALVLPAVREALSAPMGVLATPLTAIQRNLGTGRALIVLDNFEQLLAAREDIRRLLAVCPGLRILITSRETLGVFEEHAVSLRPLALEAEDSADAAAVQLFALRASKARSGFHVSEANRADVLAICRAVDGLPLAITLVAARVALFSVAQLREQLGAADAMFKLDLIADGISGLPERQRSLRGSLEWSHQRLTADEQCLFRRMAVLRDGGTLACVEALLPAVDDGARVATWNTLTLLINKSLVNAAEQADGSLRFAMLDTVREYATQCLNTSGEQLDSHCAFGRWLGARINVWARAQDGEPGGSDGYARERNNIRGVLEVLLQNADDDAASEALLSMLSNLWFLLRTWGGHAEGLSWYRRAAAAIAAPVNSAKANLKNALPSLYRGLAVMELVHGHKAESIAAAQHAVAVAMGTEHDHLELMCRFTLAEAETRLGDPRIALQVLEVAEVIATRRADPIRLALVWHGQAQACEYLGEVDRAMPLYERAASAGETLQIPFRASSSRRGLAALALVRGEYLTALRQYARAANHAHAARLHSELASALIGAAAAAHAGALAAPDDIGCLLAHACGRERELNIANATADMAPLVTLLGDLPRSGPMETDALALARVQRWLM